MPESYFEREQRILNENVRLDVANQQQFDKDRAQRIFNVGASTGLPHEFIDANLDDIEKRSRAADFNAQKYRETAPEFTSWLADNPYSLAAFQDDKKNLSRLERSWKALGTAVQSGWATTEIAEIMERQEGGDKRPEDAEELKRLKALLGTQQFNFGAPDDYFAPVHMLQSALTWTANQLPIQYWITKESMEKAAVGTSVGMTVGGLYGGAGGTVVGGPIGTGVGFAGGAAVGGFHGFTVGMVGGRYDASRRLEEYLALSEYKDMGIPHDQARRVSRLVGVVGGSLEAFGLGTLTKRIPGFRRIQRDAMNEIIYRTFEQPTMKAAMARFVAQYGEGMAVELITETGQEAMTIAGAEYLKSVQRAGGNQSPEMAAMTTAEFWDTMQQVWVQTAYGTSILGGIGPVSQMYRESRMAWQSEKLQQVWKAMGEAAKDSETRQMTPSKYTEFVERLTQGSDEIRISADAFDTYYQDQGLDPDTVALKLGIKAEDLQEAREIGSDIAIPANEYLGKIAATEDHQALMPHLKTGDMTLSYAEQNQLQANYPELMENMQKVMAGDKEALQELDQTLVSKIAGDIVATGLQDEETALQSAQVMVGFINLFKRAGKADPIAEFNKWFGGVTKTTPEALERPDVDIAVDPLLDRIRSQQFRSQRELYGTTLLRFLEEKGGVQDQGGEMTARDAQMWRSDESRKPRLVNPEGMTLDEAAEIAAEAGYLAERDIGLLMELMDKELRGEEVVGPDANQALMAEEENIQELERILEVAGIGLDQMQRMENAEVRAVLRQHETLFQPMNFGDTVLDIETTVKETGDKVKAKVPAQVLYDGKMKRRRALEKLRNCISA